jgi:hypothetical protein
MTEAEQIEAAKAALGKATPGPWYRQETSPTTVGIRAKRGFICFMYTPTKYDGQQERYEKETVEFDADVIICEAAPALVRRVQELEAENKELNDLFDLQWTRSLEADELWRAAHPGNDHVCPDLGELLTWLMGRVQELENWQAKALEALKDSASNKNRIASILRGEDWTCGQPCIGTCKNFKLIENASWKATALIEQAHKEVGE